MSKFTKGPWKFEPQAVYLESAKILGNKLAEHEGYFRDNNGDWIVGYPDQDGEMGGRIAAVTFKGTAKRGQAYNAPDPLGMANARLISAAPQLYEALESVLEHFAAPDEALEKVQKALAKARGEGE